MTTLGIPAVYYGTEQAFDGNEDYHDYGVEAVCRGSLRARVDELRNPPGDRTVTVTRQPDGRATVHVELQPAGMVIVA